MVTGSAPSALNATAPTGVPNATPSTTRRAILLTIKRQGEARAEDLAGALGITPSAIRQHLNGMLGEGLVAVREQRGGAGRPKFFYSITTAAEPLFPKNYGGLTNELLDYLDAEKPDMVDHLFDLRRQRRVEGATSRLAGRPFEDRVDELARILDEDGYLADVERGDGVWWIVEHNCAILEVALRYGQACSSEIGFLREVMPDAEIERVSHMAAGAHRCAYEVRRRRAPATTDRAAPAATGPARTTGAEPEPAAAPTPTRDPAAAPTPTPEPAAVAKRRRRRTPRT